MSINKPNFIVLGGHKCGTSSLHFYLAQHPEIYMPPIKGIDFFSREGNKGKYSTLEEYKSLYETMTNEKVAGEVSSVYLYNDKACQAIKNYLPDVKLIIILRNPVDRAFSHFNMRTQPTGKPGNLKEIFNEKEILEKGIYYPNLIKYYQAFDPQKIKIFLFEDLILKRQFNDFFEFVEVEPNFSIDTSLIMRKGGVVTPQKQKTLDFLRSTLGQLIKPFTTPEQRRYFYKKANNAITTKLVLPNDIKEKLKEYYQEDIQKTQEFLGIDLSHWLTR